MKAYDPLAIKRINKQVDRAQVRRILAKKRPRRWSNVCPACGKHVEEGVPH